MMQRCSFCRKRQGKMLHLVLARRSSKARICDECLEICGKILQKSGTDPIVGRSATYRVGSGTRVGPLICSFCGASRETVHRLIGSSPGRAIAYICGKCVELCFTAIAGDQPKPAATNTGPIRDWIARKTGVHKTSIHYIG